MNQRGKSDWKKLCPSVWKKPEERLAPKHPLLRLLGWGQIRGQITSISGEESAKQVAVAGAYYSPERILPHFRP